MSVRNEPSWQKLEALFGKLASPNQDSRFIPQLSVKEPGPSNNYSSLNGRVKNPLRPKRKENTIQ